MKNIILFLALISFTYTLNAQMPGVPANGKNQPPAIGHIYGKLVDSSGRAMGDVSVILLQTRRDQATGKTKNVLVKGLTTKSNGEFSFEELPLFGRYNLKISATGFKTIEKSIGFKLQFPAGGSAKPSDDPAQAMKSIADAINNFDLDLGNIKMNNEVKQLETVTVTGSKPLLKMDIDKKVYNVEKDIVNAGGTGLDVMKNVPSVNVDIDGNVTLRNSAPQLYIDGRPTTLTLDQIPADAIESVEVITNPSAKYDASGGGAGILNIILKKNRKSGYNGNLRSGVDSHGAFNGGGNFNLREDKFNFTAAFFANQNKGITRGTTDRTNIGDTVTTLYQTNYDRNNGAFLFGSLGLDYFLSNRTTLSLAGIKVHGGFTPSELLNYTTDSLFSSHITSNYTTRNSNTERQFNANGFQLGLKHLFPKKGEELTADLHYFSGVNSNNSLYLSDYYDEQGGTLLGTQQQKTIGQGTNVFKTIQTDYVNPLTEKTKLEAGLRLNSQNLVSNTSNYFYNDSAQGFLISPAASTDYKNTNNVYAAYATLTSSIKNFGYQAGLRAESSNYTGELINEKESFKNSYPISLFPSLFLSQKLANKQELQISYTRRINRPNFFQLIPYTNYSDSLNITRGNPNLVPEFTNSVEASYLKTFKGNNTFLFSVYYKLTTNLITQYIDTGANALTGGEALINTFVNAHSSRTVGAEFTSVNTINKWWDMTTNVNLYNSFINTSNLDETTQSPLWSWFGKINSNFKLPAKIKLQVTFIYQSKTNLPVNANTQNMGGPPNMQSQSASQGYIKAFYGLDAAISRSFLKNDAATLSVSMGDILRSRWSDQYSQSPYFTQEYNRLRDPQLVRVNFTWRFGKLDASLFKRKNMNGSQDAMQGVQQ